MSDQTQSTILVVDDTEANIDILVGALDDLYDVCVAMDGESALQIVDENSPDLILLDIMMPGIDGYEVCKKIKDNPENNAIPIIFITAMTEIKDKTKGFSLGAVDYITKPFEIVEVQARVETHLALQDARKQLQNQNEILEDKVQERTKEVTQLNEELKQSMLNSVRILIGLIEGFDPSLGSHSKRVAILSREIGKALGVSSEELFQLEIASLLHDIGTLTIPERLKHSQTSKISKEELALVRQHTMFTQSVLSPAKGLNEVGVLIRNHKENIDGSGFPDGLVGKDIPLGAKIIGAANAYDEIRNSKDVNAQTMSQKIKEELAIQNITKLAGTRYEENIIKALINVINEYHEKKKEVIRITIDELKPDQILAKNLYTNQGKLIMSKGTKLSAYIIQRMESFKVAKLVSDLVYVYMAH